MRPSGVGVWAWLDGLPPAEAAAFARELEDQGRLMQTVFETVGTGLVVADAEGAITGLNGAACQLLDLPPESAGRRLDEVLTGGGREAVAALIGRQLAGRGARQKGEIVVAAGGRDRHLSVQVVPLAGPPGSPASWARRTAGRALPMCRPGPTC